MDNIDIDDLLEMPINEQAGDIDTSDEFADGIHVLVLNTPDEDLKGYIGEIGTTDNTVRYKEGNVKKTKVLFEDGGQGYFKNDYLIEVGEE